MAVADVDALIIDLDGRSSQIVQLAFEQPIHDLLVEAWWYYRERRIPRVGWHQRRPRAGESRESEMRLLQSYSRRTLLASL